VLSAGVRQSIGRERFGREIAQHGLHLTDWKGANLEIAPGQLRLALVQAAEAGGQRRWSGGGLLRELRGAARKGTEPR